MPKSFAHKDVQGLLSFYKKLFRDLDEIESKEDGHESNLSYVASTLSKEGFFSKMAEEGLKGQIIDWSDSNLIDFVMAIYRCKEGAKCVSAAKDLRKSYEDRIRDLISSAKRGGNAVSWLFASKKKKEDAESAYQELVSLKEGSFSKIASSISEKMASLDKKGSKDAFDDFFKSKAKYGKIFQEVCGSLSEDDEGLPGISKREDQYRDAKTELSGVTNKVDQFKQNVKDAVQRLCLTELLTLLKGIPVDNLAKEAPRVKIKCLRDAGYLTYADIFAANAMQISSAYGVSLDAAYTVKNICDKHAKEAYKSIKIKLTPDSKSKESTGVVKAIDAYLELESASIRIDVLNKNDIYSLSILFQGFEKLGGGESWLFLDDEEVERYRYSYKVFEATLDHFLKEAKDIASSAKVSSISTAKAWEDFSANSVKFYNVIEELCPGVLGNEDSIYGLPEDLAREIQDECYFPDGLLCTLRKYQEWGVKYILHQGKVLLGDEMGLGKTVQAIASMVSLRNTGATHFMVVCPASVLTNWCREIAKHSKLKYIKIHGAGKGAAFKTWLKIGGVAVTNYESLSSLQYDENFHFSMLVADEAHYLKNENSRRSINARNLAAHADRLLFMTGTALENKVDEMISLINVLNPSIAKAITPIAFMSTAPAFREKVAPVYYRRKREDVLTELPDKIEMEEWCTLGAEEMRDYENNLLNSHYMTARRLSWNMDDLTKSAKATRLKEIVEEAEGEGRKVLVFSFFLDTLYKIHDFLRGKCLNPITGKVNPNRRQEILDEFDKAEPGSVLLAQISSGGTGLNIQAASVVVICEPQLKPSIENQAISRAYRMGQTRKVLVYRLLAEDTIDEKITNLLKAKQEIFDAYADKSVAAEKCEVDETTFGNIIKEEIDRIKKKRAESGEEVPASNEEDDSEHAPEPLGEEYYDSLMSMSYDELVAFLLKKYGPVKGDYFANEKCVSVTKFIKRTGEGLFIHHIDEDKIENLSNPNIARMNSPEYQKANRLVYCNYLEHLLLHILIVENVDNGNPSFGYGGVFVFLIPHINDVYNDYPFSIEWAARAALEIRDDMSSYLKMVKRAFDITVENPILSSFGEGEGLAKGTDGTVNEEIASLVDSWR